MPSLKPQQIDKENWYYEYPTYLLLVHEVKLSDGTHCKTDSIKIHWRKIKKSLSRSYKPRKPKKATRR